jgi:hypothetical protein
MKTRVVVSSAILALLPAVAAPGRSPAPRHGAWPRVPAPTTVTVTVDGEVLTLDPHTTSDFSTPSDPVNLVFLHSDPRAIRQELMKLSGDRTPDFPVAPPFDCRWTDAMGYEQAAYAEPEGWVGGEVQLACVNPGAPLGNPFRFHVRLFRSGQHTLGAAHFEILIPGSAEHETLSWDFARQFVALDMARTQTLMPPTPGAVALVPAGTFGAVRRPVYDGIVATPGGMAILTLVGLYPLPPGFPPDANVPIPTDGTAATFSPTIDFQPVLSDQTTTFQGIYDLDAPKPFCGPALVHLAGQLQLRLRVQTNPSGKYLRTYGVSGALQVTPLVPPGAAAEAIIFEAHRGMLTDNYGEVTERGSQIILGQPRQFKAWTFGAGQHDYFRGRVGCGLP